MRNKVLVAGCHGAGTTWVLNIVREFMLLRDPRSEPLSGWIEQEPSLHLVNLMNRHRWVMKCHGFHKIQDWVEFVGCDVVFVTRPLHECKLSMQRRFGYSYEQVNEIIDFDVAALEPLRATAKTIGYHTHNISSEQGVQHIVDVLQIQHTPAEVSRVAFKYSKENVRAFTQSLRLGNLGVMQDNRGVLYDANTLLQQNHVSD